MGLIELHQLFLLFFLIFFVYFSGLAPKWAFFTQTAPFPLKRGHWRPELFVQSFQIFCRAAQMAVPATSVTNASGMAFPTPSAVKMAQTESPKP